MPSVTVVTVLGPPFDVLLAQARAGDEQAFATLWHQFHPPLLRYLRATAGREGDDIASDVWLEVIRGLERFEGDETGFRSWLFTIARLRRIDRGRRLARATEYATPDDDLDQADDRIDPALAIETQVSTEAALAVIATLPADQAEVVLLRAVAGLDVAAVAEIVGKSPGSVRVLSHRGLRGLAGRLSGRDSDQALEV